MLAVVGLGVLVLPIGQNRDSGGPAGAARLIDDGEMLRFPPTSAIAPDADAESELLLLLNSSRDRVDLPPLQVNARLAALARSRSRDMYRRGYFSHVDPDGLSYFDLLRRQGIPYTKAAENLAIAPSANEAHEYALASSRHRGKMLDPGFCRIGIGVYAGPRGLIITELFLTWRPYGTPPSSTCPPDR